MTSKDQEAKQLDSVTDVVQEKEIDASKAQEAMSALGNNAQDQDSAAETGVAVSKEDVDLIVSELEVTEEVATRALRRETGDVVAALRQLVTNTTQ